jgi:hypothetical protein
MRYFDRQGNEIDSKRWTELMGEPDYCIVKRYESDTVTISTVWLGLDHNYYDKGDPLIFEIAIFYATWDRILGRFSTEEDAICAHDYFVEEQNQHE